MDLETRERMFGVKGAFGDPFVVYAISAVVLLLLVTPGIIALLSMSGKLSDRLLKELWERYFSWVVLVPLMAGPVLLGAAYAIAAVGVMSLVCYREYARATGLFRERSISVVVAVGIILVTLASLDNWYGLFVALWPLTVGLIAAVAILSDRPGGFIQRVGLGVLGYMLFGSGLGHLGFFGNDQRYRRILIWILLCVELNDIFAFICGKSFGKRKLAPNTSPNKTWAGAIGATILTTIISAVLARVVFSDTRLARWYHLVIMGVLIAVLGQMGDLLLSSIKRDIGIKDMGNTFPGHGGALDRFNSLLLVSPAIFHYVGYFIGVGLSESAHIFTHWLL